MEGKQIYVAIDGTDDARGTLEQPFVSLHRAIAEIRQIHQSQPKTGVTIIIGNGIYPIRQPLTLAAEVSGTAEHPIRFVAQSPGEVRLIGGEIVTNFEPVTDPQVLDRLDPTVHGKVVQADLVALGITDFGSVNEGGSNSFSTSNRRRSHIGLTKGLLRSPIWLAVTRSMSVVPKVTGSESFTTTEIAPNGGNRKKRLGYMATGSGIGQTSGTPLNRSTSTTASSLSGHLITAMAIVKGSGFMPSTCCQRSIDPVSGTWIVKAVYYIFTRLWRTVRRLFR